MKLPESPIGLSFSIEGLKIILHTFLVTEKGSSLVQVTQTTALMTIAEALTSIAESLALKKEASYDA